MISRRHVLRIGGVLTVTGALGTQAAPASAAARRGAECPTTPTARAAPVAEANLLPNPGLEEVINGLPAQWTPWNAASGPLVHSSNEQVHSGAWSVRIDDPGSAGPGLRSAYMPATAEINYLATAYAYVVTGTAQLLIEYWNAAGTRISATAVTTTHTGTWEQLRLTVRAPAGTNRATVLFYCTAANTGTAYFDDASFEEVHWEMAVWGGDYLTRGRTSDSLTVHVAALRDPLAFDRVEALGTVLTLLPDNRATGPDACARWDADASFSWDADSGALVLPSNADGHLTISDIRFQPPVFDAFTRVTLHEVNGDRDHTIWVAAAGFLQPNHGFERAKTPHALEAARKASDYFEGRRTADGAVLIAHATWPGDLEPEPQGNADIATANLRLWELTGESTYRRRAERTLDWLVAVQQDSGGFGFPWAWGASRSHFTYPGHYPNRVDHPVGTPYAVITANSALALIDGYEALDRPDYLTAARRAVNYLLHDANGFQWLDDAHTRGSIPYCTIAPIDANGGMATNVYNIDAFGMMVLARLARLTGDEVLYGYGDALARNMSEHLDADDSIAYAWYNPTWKPTDYASICYSGLLTWGRLRGVDEWVAKARDGITWMTNVDQPSQLLWEDVTQAMGGLDNTNTVVSYLSSQTLAQLDDGSWSGGTATRTDAVIATSIARLLKQMENPA